MSSINNEGGKARVPMETTKKGLPVFNSYMSLFQVQEKLQKGEVIEGVLRINPKNYEDAYISAPDGEMDIYIGGVPDRNAALHGDLVGIELYRPKYWKVLYEQLDIYLDSDETLKKTVYEDHDPFDSMDEFVPPAALASSEQGLQGNEQLKHDNSSDVNSSNINADNAAAAASNNTNVTDSKKKKRRRKGKKNNKKEEDKIEMDGQQADGVTTGARQAMDGLPVDKHTENVMDSVTIISSNLTKENVVKFTSMPSPEPSNKQAIVVPPDMLSSCSDMTDDESACSAEIDLETVQEYSEFVKARLSAEKRAKKAAVKVTQARVRLVSTGEEVVVDASDRPLVDGKKESLGSAFSTKPEENSSNSEKKDCKQPQACSGSKNGGRKETVLDRLKAMNKNQPKPEEVTQLQVQMSNIAIKNEKSEKNLTPDVNREPPNPSQLRAQNNKMNHPLLRNNPANYSEARAAAGGRTPAEKFVSTHRGPSVAQVMRLCNWKRFIQKVAHVVYIFERRNTRLAAGTIKPFADKNRNFALFSPKDTRIPRMKIPMSQCPPDLFARYKEYARRIYLAKITKWNEPKFALGEMVKDIGCHGEIMAETEAFLLQMGVDYKPFPAAVLSDLPAVPDSGWTIPPEAFEGRLDLRDTCIFTIDPATARDLDDALSIEALPNERYKIGVHIADVSYFVPQNSELDRFASERATSVYLVDRVIPMLPGVLSEQLCSLQPNTDRLAFSVIWEMDRYGHIKSTWFGRTVIRSCVKLSYEQAQSAIDNPTPEDWNSLQMPQVKGFSIAQVCDKIIALHNVAVHLRKKRHRDGALRLDQRKIVFHLDHTTKMPSNVATTQLTPANNLIEEFMLKANIAVAEKIREEFPDRAVLRCHPEPQGCQLEDVVSLLRTMNVEIDSSCAGAIYSSILGLAGNDEDAAARLDVIVNLLSKPMQNALYICSGTHAEDDYSHYALNVPFYTHFTSPIRRYPDIMVHRLLAAAVDPQRYPLAALDPIGIDKILGISNEKKQAAKRASEFSSELYLAEFVKQMKEVETEAVVMGVLSHALDVLLIDFCAIKRAYLDNLPLDALNYDSKSKDAPPTLYTVWSPDPAHDLPSVAQSYTFFTRVKVTLTPFTNEQLKFNVTLRRPDL